MSGLVSAAGDFVRRRVPWAVIDACIVALGFYAAYLFRYLATPTESLASYFEPLNALVLPLVILFVAMNHVFRLDRRLWRYASAQEVVTIALSAGTSTLAATLFDVALTFRGRPLPLSVVLLGGFFSLTGFVAVRYRARLINGLMLRWQGMGRPPAAGRTRTLIYGAGESGQLLARRMLSLAEGRGYQIVGFVDDDRGKRGMRIHEIEVRGGGEDLPSLVDRERADLIVLAMPNVQGDALRSILSLCQETSAQIRTIPSVVGSVTQPPIAPLLREIGVQDLLGRRPAKVDVDAARAVLAGKVVLVTGGCGSIGSELCRQIAGFEPARLVVLDNNESGLFDLEVDLKLQVPNLPLQVVVGDVTDPWKLDSVFRSASPSAVFHVAAYKHVPLMELYPEEAVRVNVGGSRLLVQKSLEYAVGRLVFVSTDKAVRPESVMGATKRIAEMLVLAAAHQSGRDYTVVRFGNVLGSRGSVVPTFARQIELGGPVTVTDPDATRYFMETSEAVALVLQAAALAKGGDTLILDMGERIRVDDLARKMIRLRGLRPEQDIPITYLGLRPGEKLHEDLLYTDEERCPTSHPQVYRLDGQAPVDERALALVVEDLLSLARTGSRQAVVQAVLEAAGARRTVAGAGPAPL